MSKEQLAGLVTEMRSTVHPEQYLEKWIAQIEAILATLPVPGVVSDEAVGEIDWDGDAKAFAEFYPGRDLPLGAKLYLAPAVPAGEVAEALEFLLTRIGGWTSARWDQHLRHEFGDEHAEPMIRALAAAAKGVGRGE